MLRISETSNTTLRFIQKVFLKESIFYTLSALFVYSSLITNFVSYALGAFSPSFDKLTLLIRNGAYLILAMLLLLHLLIEFSFHRIVLCAAITFFYIITLWLSLKSNPDLNIFARNSVLTLVTRLLPAFYIGIRVDNYSIFINYLKKFRFISIPYILLILVLFNIVSIEHAPALLNGAYMIISQNLLIPVLVYFFVMMEKSSAINVILFATHISFVFIYGSRGALLYIAVPIVLYFVFHMSNLAKRQKFWLVVAFVVIFLVVFCIFILKQQLTELFKDLPKARNLMFLLTDGLLNIKSRIPFLQPSIEAIGRAPLSARGFFADSVLSARSMGIALGEGIYSHNLIIELLVDFGAIFGGLIIIGIVIMFVLSVKHYFVETDKLRMLYILLAFVVSPFVNSMFSGSFVITNTYWLAFAFLLNFCIRHLSLNIFLDKKISRFIGFFHKRIA